MNDTLVTLGLFLFVLYLSVDGFFSMYDDSVQWGIYLFKLIQSVGAFIFALSSQFVLWYISMHDNPASV